MKRNDLIKYIIINYNNIMTIVTIYYKDDMDDSDGRNTYRKRFQKFKNPADGDCLFQSVAQSTNYHVSNEIYNVEKVPSGIDYKDGYSKQIQEKGRELRKNVCELYDDDDFFTDDDDDDQLKKIIKIFATGDSQSDLSIPVDQLATYPNSEREYNFVNGLRRETTVLHKEALCKPEYSLTYASFTDLYIVAYLLKDKYNFTCYQMAADGKEDKGKIKMVQIVNDVNNEFVITIYYNGKDHYEVLLPYEEDYTSDESQGTEYSLSQGTEHSLSQGTEYLLSQGTDGEETYGYETDDDETDDDKTDDDETDDGKYYKESNPPSGPPTPGPPTPSGPPTPGPVPVVQLPPRELKIPQVNSFFKYPLVNKENIDIKDLLFNKFCFTKKPPECIEISKTTAIFDYIEPPKFDVLQCSEKAKYYDEEIKDRYIRLIMDKLDPPGDGDDDDIDLMLFNIKQEIEAIENENKDVMKKTYTLFGGIDNFVFKENDKKIVEKMNQLFNIGSNQYNYLLEKL